MEEKPSLGDSKNIKVGDLVQWRHWADGWTSIIGIVTSIYTKKMSGRRVTMVKVTTTSAGDSDTIRIGQEVELNPLSLQIISTLRITD
tara:strand:- start:721 stop:984 length:264 start_codon:yes stop_codon:yes gene_type:complete